MLRDAGFRAALELDPRVDPVCGDAPQIQQLVMNLMLNAVRAMTGTPADEHEITIGSASAACA